MMRRSARFLGGLGCVLAMSARLRLQNFNAASTNALQQKNVNETRFGKLKFLSGFVVGC